ncbi:MAG: MGH1-like glycoside hydrolase domain-containing protein [Bryobacteraceae bacterium]
MPAERTRLEQAQRREKHWKRWGPYLAERSWGNPREDYSRDGNAWESFTHDHARSRVYRWTEDGICGICDNHQRLCLAFAFWNGRDPILKERLFGLSGPEGNHGEDVKEYYYYLDSTPTHSYMKALYKYPQNEYPYTQLTESSSNHSRQQPEYELIDTGIFDQDRYFDIFAEYAKADVDDILIRATVVNRGPERATLHFLPTLWFRNTWAWGYGTPKPEMKRGDGSSIAISEESMGSFQAWFEGEPELLFTDNETNSERFWKRESNGGFYKDGFHERIIHGRRQAVNPEQKGTKACAWYQFELQPGESRVLHARLSPANATAADFDAIFKKRIQEADEFYSFAPEGLSPDARSLQRQAFAGLLWSKQYYHFVVQQWLDGDPAFPPPPPERKQGRNRSWPHLFSEDVLSIPDKWEYPWFAAWDLAFHMIPLALVDPDYAKDQLARFLREWYMSPDGQLPAYEWEFSDVNPPVHSWACWRVFKIDWKLRGKPDFEFLESVFHKLLMNFTWWVNRKDSQGNNIFEGGFLGLDNIGVFDRSKPLPTGGYIEQADGTAWMAMYCLTMLRIAMELTPHDRSYEDIASKFFEHFLFIAAAVNRDDQDGLWDETDGFYYDWLKLPGGNEMPLRVRSLVGLIPLFAVATIEQEEIDRMPGFKRRMRWFIENRQDLCGNIASITRQGKGERRLLSVVQRPKLIRLLARMLDETEFLSPHGIRSVSRFHHEHPFVLNVDGQDYGVAYEPAESTSGLFGGNSNWRGPVWFPPNYLLIESLQRFHHYFGDDLTVECPSSSGRQMNLGQVAAELSRRLSRIFLCDADRRRPVFGGAEKFQTDPHFRDYILFYEYFHGDNGAGLGASHQTGWTALVAKLLQQTPDML